MGGQCIAVVSGKGGTGKTSFTAGVGAALAMSGRRVLCLDCDVGLRNLDLALGLSDRALMDFTDVVRGRCLLEDAVVAHPRLPTLCLLTAPVRARSAAYVTEEDMNSLLAQVREAFDFCLLDAPAGLSGGFLLATAGADRCAVVTTPDATSLRDAQRAVMELGRFGRGTLHLAVNRVRKKILRSMHATIDDAIDKAGLPLIGVIPEDESMLLCLHQGLPPALSPAPGHAAAAYRNIARRLQGESVPLLRIK